MSTDIAAARQAHIDLMNRYADTMDNLNWTDFADLFTADAVFAAKHRQGAGPGAVVTDVLSLAGRDAIVGTLSKLIGGLSATHHMTSNYMVEVAPDGASAQASCYFRGYHAGKDERAHLFEESLGRFDFKTVRIGAAWKITRMEETIMVMLGTPEAFGPMS